MRRTGGASWSVQRAEHGALPMGLASPLPAVPWTRAGLFHGGARPSTGYAFQRIQAWAEACAGALRSGARTRKTAEHFVQRSLAPSTPTLSASTR